MNSECSEGGCNQVKDKMQVKCICVTSIMLKVFSWLDTNCSVYRLKDVRKDVHVDHWYEDWNKNMIWYLGHLSFSLASRHMIREGQLHYEGGWKTFWGGAGRLFWGGAGRLFFSRLLFSVDVKAGFFFTPFEARFFFFTKNWRSDFFKKYSHTW